jgi:hypothetical protein
MTYAVITSARNEEQFLDGLIASMAEQTALPTLWLVVIDNSEDSTLQIAEAAATTRAWMRVRVRRNAAGLGFDSKAAAVMEAYESLRNEPFDVVAFLDADIAFDPGYCQSILSSLAADNRLGVAGSGYREGSRRFYARRMANYANVPGGCQFFRRECFDAIGGYEPLPKGGIDTMANTRARMLGWRTAIVPGLFFRHRRPGARGGRGNLAASVLLGERAYLLGGHPLWESARVLTHMARKPPVIGAALELLGYWRAAIRRTKRPLPPDVVAFRRSEQWQRIVSAPSKLFAREPAVDPSPTPDESKYSPPADQRG